MEKYKGYSVPGVGEFVSESTKPTFIMMDYCKQGGIDTCINIKCLECLFSKERLTLQWHEARA